MKNLTLVLLAVVALGFLVAPSRAGDEVDKNLTKQMSDILTEWKKITPGTTRAELLKVFTTEGGISTAKHRTFVHRRCPYIKVDVDFTLSDPPGFFGLRRSPRGAEGRSGVARDSGVPNDLSAPFLVGSQPTANSFA